jgi:TolB protein
MGARVAVLLMAVAVVGAACSPSNPDPSPASSSPSASAESSEVAVSTPPATVTTTTEPTDTPAPSSIALDRPLAASGSIAVERVDGSLSIVDADGATRSLAGASEGRFGFPTWSPDATRIAAIRTSSTDTAIIVFDAARPTTGLPATPRVIFQNANSTPFYLSWTPDSKNVSFLASDPNALTLRIAPADGSGPGAVIRAGSPLYFDWIDNGRLMAHIGTGADAFLGEIGTDGASVAPAIRAPGTFRSADVSSDGLFVGYVRAGATGEDSVVVAARDGSSEHVMSVFGMGAVDFGPTDDVLASIGSTLPLATADSVPIGPLRLIDARSGKTRTLLDGSVVSFAWSPDGKTIAAIHVIPIDATPLVSSSSPATTSAPTGQNEVRLAFVDVASGKIRSEPLIAPGQTFVRALLTYFDQYALSHRLWAPDSSSILLPQFEPDGTTRVDVFYPDGGTPVSIDGEIGFWSP